MERDIERVSSQSDEDEKFIAKYGSEAYLEAYMAMMS